MSQPLLPLARRNGLVVQDLPPDEILVYDKEAQTGLCLNRAAALVWRRCDGVTTVGELTRQLQGELGIDSAEAAEDAVWLAIDRLSRAHLLVEPLTPPVIEAGLSRRECVKKLAIVSALSIPVLASLKAPTVSAACTPQGGACTQDNQCCTGLICCGRNGRGNKDKCVPDALC